MRLIIANDDQYINLAQVVTIEEEKSVAFMTDGRRIGIRNVDSAIDLCRLPATAIPAQADYAFLRMLKDKRVEQLPIIAWLIDPLGQEYATMPVTVDGVPRMNDIWAVQQPDGRVVDIGNAIYSSYQEWHDEAVKTLTAPAAKTG